MMESSQFTNSQFRFDSMEQVESQGATCDAFCVKLYGKLHFLKRLKPQFATDTRYQEAFRKEFETGFRLEHPNLVRYISFDDDGILMEYIDGETLTQRIACQPDFFHRRKNVNKFIRQLLDAVGYLHSHQVLHLDLKPDNILLTHIGDDVKLIDLGCCLTDTFTDTTGRTPAFAAPEQLHSSPHILEGGAKAGSEEKQVVGAKVDVRTDIYALGKILEQLPHHHIYNHVIARCTASDMARRYASVEDLKTACLRRTNPLSILLPILLVLAVTALLWLWLSRASDKDTAAIIEDDIPVQTTLSDDSTSISGVVVPQQDSSPIPSGQSKQEAVPWEVVDLRLRQGMDSLCSMTIATYADSLPTNSWYEAHRRFDEQAMEFAFQLRATYPQYATDILTKTSDYFQQLSDSIFHQTQHNGQGK